jgi:hypothetical protein
MRCSMMFALLATVVTWSGCATDDEEDGGGTEVDLASFKSDGSTLIGKFELGAPGKAAGDIEHLQLRSDGIYVRVQCYGTGCTKHVRETDHYHVVKTPAGKTFVRFERFDWINVSSGTTKQVTVDTYEYVKVSGGLNLRKAFTTRWNTLTAPGDQALCFESHGTWKPTATLPGAATGTTTHCDCGQNANTFPHPAWVPGAGGCIMPAATGESDCDATKGHYTDDDTDALGDYCLCPIHMKLTNTGCTAI